MKYFLSFLFLFLFATPVFAYSDWNDDFETYTTGQTITSQNSAYHYSVANATVVNSGCYSGKCMSMPQSSHINYETDGTSPYQYLSFKIKPAGAVDVRLQYDYSVSYQNLILCDVTASSTFTCDYDLLSDGGATDLLVVDSDFDLNEWHTVTFNYDSINNRFRVQTDSNDFTDWFDPWYGTPGDAIEKLYWTSTVGTTLIDDIVSSDIFIEGIIRDFSNTFGYDLSAKIETVLGQTCFIGDTCNLYFSYNQAAIGDKVYLMYDTVTGQSIPNAIASTTIVMNEIMQNYLVVPAIATSSTQEYCLYLDHANGQTLQCGIDVNWMTHDTFDELFNRYDPDSACDDLTAPTSTDSWFSDWSIDSLSYTMQCAGRKFTYWMMTPHPDAYLEFEKSVNSLKQSFPISIYYDVKEQFDEAASSTETFATLNMPGIFSGIVLLSTSTISSSPASSMWTTIYDSLETIIYAMVFFYFIYRIIKIAKNK